MMGQNPRCYVLSFVEIVPPVQEKIFKGFCYLYPWWPSWSCDLERLYNILVPDPKDGPHEIWL